MCIRGRGKVAPERWADYETLLERFRTEQAGAEHRFVTLALGVGYQATGRHQDQATAAALRTPLLDSLRQRFGVSPTVLISEAGIEAYPQARVAEVLGRRRPTVVRRASP